MDSNTTAHKLTSHDIFPVLGKAKTGAQSPKKHKKC